MVLVEAVFGRGDSVFWTGGEGMLTSWGLGITCSAGSGEIVVSACSDPVSGVTLIFFLSRHLRKPHQRAQCRFEHSTHAQHGPFSLVQVLLKGVDSCCPYS